MFSWISGVSVNLFCGYGVNVNLVRRFGLGENLVLRSDLKSLVRGS